MRELKTAIKNIYNNHLLSSACNLYFTVDYKTARTPYIKVETITSKTNYRMTNGNQSFRTQFSIFAKNEESIYDILELVKDAYQDTELSYDSHNHTQCRSFNESGLMYIDDVYQYVIEFEIIRSISK